MTGHKVLLGHLNCISCTPVYALTFLFHFTFQQIDGEAFLLLNQTDIVKILEIKLGPALKIYNAILIFKNRLDI